MLPAPASRRRPGSAELFGRRHQLAHQRVGVDRERFQAVEGQRDSSWKVGKAQRQPGPDGTFVRLDSGDPALVLGDALVSWTTRGYAARRARPRPGDAEVITPPSSVAVLRAGYRVQLDASASAERA